MLKMEARGDKHPKTFVLITDDSQAELATIDDVLNDGAADADPMLAWFRDYDEQAFARGVEVPADMVGDFAEVLEAAGFWDDGAEVVDREMMDALDHVNDEGGER